MREVGRVGRHRQWLEEGKMVGVIVEAVTVELSGEAV
jgi:hypothetical protein